MTSNSFLLDKIMGSDHNLTPDQLAFPKPIRREAYRRLPETCERVREILNEVQDSFMQEFNIDPADIAGVDAIISQAFLRIRNEVTQEFRTEQMRLLSLIEESKS
jgi:hypothetical protein